VPDLRPEQIEAYLAALEGVPVRVVRMAPLGEEAAGTAVKEYGYGRALLVEYDRSGQRRKAVLETLPPRPFGREHPADRAAVLLWSHRAYNRLPRHVRSLDVGAFRAGGGMVSLGEAEEFFLLTEFAPGRAYVHDLARIQAQGRLAAGDLDRADALCDYLAEIHAEKGPDPGLYTRRIRELVGHGECIFGLCDSYPPDLPAAWRERLERLEHACVSWRWRIKDRVHRLRRVHGDFHPYNILFGKGTDFTVLDRSRGEWGEPADDVTCLSGNYLFCALQQRGRLEGPFADLFLRFWERYLERTGDREILEVAAPFFAFRCLVMASPVWYPRLEERVRLALFRFAEGVLAAPAFDAARAHRLLEE